MASLIWVDTYLPLFNGIALKRTGRTFQIQASGLALQECYCVKRLPI